MSASNDSSKKRRSSAIYNAEELKQDLREVKETSNENSLTSSSYSRPTYDSRGIQLRNKIKVT